MRGLANEFHTRVTRCFFFFFFLPESRLLRKERGREGPHGVISGPQFGPGCVWGPFLEICGTPDTGRGAEDPWARDARRDPSVHAAGQIHILQHHTVWTPVFKAHIPCCPQSRRPAQPWTALPGSYMFIHTRRVRLKTNPHKKTKRKTKKRSPFSGNRKAKGGEKKKNFLGNNHKTTFPGLPTAEGHVAMETAFLGAAAPRPEGLGWSVCPAPRPRARITPRPSAAAPEMCQKTLSGGEGPAWRIPGNPEIIRSSAAAQGWDGRAAGWGGGALIRGQRPPGGGRPGWGAGGRPGGLGFSALTPGHLVSISCPILIPLRPNWLHCIRFFHQPRFPCCQFCYIVSFPPFFFLPGLLHCMPFAASNRLPDLLHCIHFPSPKSSSAKFVALYPFPQPFFLF